MMAVNVALVGSIVTVLLFLAGVIYHAGKLAARVTSLEEWRKGIRQDMHEISDKLELISTELKQLMTLVDERTERRVVKRSERE